MALHHYEFHISATYHGKTLYKDSTWTAIDIDTYDGAPDSKPPYSCVGVGDTEMSAIQDLITQILAAYLEKKEL